MKVDIVTDLQSLDEDDLLWAYLDEASDPALVVPGAVLVAGDDRAGAMVEVVELVPADAGTLVRMRQLPGVIEQYAQALRRADVVG